METLKRFAIAALIVCTNAQWIFNMAGKKERSGGSRPNSGPKKKLDLVPANFRILVTQKAWLVKHGDQNKTVRRLIQAEIDNELKESNNEAI